MPECEREILSSCCAGGCLDSLLVSTEWILPGLWAHTCRCEIPIRIASKSRWRTGSLQSSNTGLRTPSTYRRCIAPIRRVWSVLNAYIQLEVLSAGLFATTFKTTFQVPALNPSSYPLRRIHLMRIDRDYHLPPDNEAWTSIRNSRGV